MKGVGRLIKNELIKIFGQLSWKIITVLILVIAILTPLTGTIFNSIVISDGNFYREAYEESAEGSMEKEYYGAYADAWDFFYDNGITYDDWRYEEYFVEYQDLMSTVRALELAKNGKSYEEVFGWFYVYDFNYMEDEDGNVVIEYYDEETDQFMPVTEDIIEKEYAESKAELDKMSDDILHGSIKTYAQGQIDMMKLQIALKEEELAQSKAEYEADPEKMYDYRADYFNLYASKASLAVLEALANASADDEEWLLDTARQTFHYTDKGAMLATLSRGDFENDYSFVESYGTYEKYCEIMDKSYYDNIAAVDILRYSAENGKPLPEMYPSSTRYTIMESVTGNVSFILLLCIILAATIMASEHMAGTIRLLVIRPRARWKILLSKLMAIVIYGLAAFAVASALSVAVTLIVSGTGDIAVPMLLHRHGEVKEVSFVIYLLAKTAIIALPDLLILTAAFFLSVAAKKVVFAVAIPMLITMFGSVASSLTVLFHAKLPFLKWTLLPYFITEGYTTDVVTRTASNALFDFTSLGFDLEIGVVLFIIHVAIFTALSFIVFRRQQIKN